jgi:hypothetical protein
VFQVRGRGRRVPVQPDGVLRGQPLRQIIRVVAPRQSGANRLREPDGRDGGVQPPWWRRRCKGCYNADYTPP